MFKSILIAVDSSTPSNNAIVAGCKLAEEQNSQLHMVHAPMAYTEIVPTTYSSTSIPPLMKQIEESAKTVMTSALKIAQENNANEPISKIIYGQPANVIVDYAAENDIDLIIMGRRGLGTITGILVGSVTNKVNQLAPCAVLTVK